MDVRSIAFGACLMLFAGAAAVSHYGHGVPIADDETGQPLGPLITLLILLGVGGTGLLGVVVGVLRRR